MPVPSMLRSYALDWHRRQQPRGHAGRSEQELLALREALISPEEVNAFIDELWPEERERWAKDPIPPYEEGGPAP